MKNFILFFLCFLCGVSAFAQPKDLKTIREDKQSDGYVGVALVIGNAAYKFATPLNSPVNDANDMAKTLGNLGFKVLRVRSNATLDEMETAIVEFGNDLEKNKGVGVFYYSGHGVQSNGLNYLIPVDSNIPTEFFLKQKAIDLESVMATMENATRRAKIVILDACRNDPFKGWRAKGSADKGLAKVDAPDGMLIAFATSPKRTAADGNGRNSPYTEILLSEIVQPNTSITDMLQDVRSALAEKYNQISWENTSLLGRFCFAGCKIPVTAPNIGGNTGGNRNTGNTTPTAGTVRKNSSGMEFVYIPAGSFKQGSPDGEKDRFKDEGPQKNVTISQGFWMGKFEITQGQWQAVTGNNPSNFKECGVNCPVEQVSWDDVQEFIKKLNEKGDGKYRLPTEAEWEYAARAGTTTRFYWGDDAEYREIGKYGWYGGNSDNKTHEVGLKLPNDFGLYDMSGNVWEWTADYWDDKYSGRAETDPRGPASVSYRVYRGGSWIDNARDLRSALRFYYTPSLRSSNLGFRLIRE